MKVLKKQNTQENNINNQIRRIDKTKKKTSIRRKKAKIIERMIFINLMIKIQEYESEIFSTKYPTVCTY